MANFITADEAINEIEDGSDLSDLSDEEDSLFDTDIGEEDLLSDWNMENDNNDDYNDGDMWSPWRSGSSDLQKSEEGQPLGMINRGFKKYLILLLILAEVCTFAFAWFATFCMQNTFAWFATLKWMTKRRQFNTAKLVLENLDYIQENASKTTTQNCIKSEETSSHR